MSDTGARSEDRGRIELNWEAVDRFATACRTNDSVIAAFLGGSLASGLADEESDLDLYVVVSESDYEGFLIRSEEFLRSWGDVVFSTAIRNFENLGFDMVLFTMADGVEGELALATERTSWPRMEALTECWPTRKAIVTAVRAYLAWGPDAARSVGARYPAGLADTAFRRIERSLGRKAGAR